MTTEGRAVHDLGGSSWLLCEPASRRSWPATVPGSVHLDLLRVGEIPDPFWRTTEQDLRWIGEHDWVYRRAIVLPEQFLRRDHLLLRFYGLDTLARVRINGRNVLRADNMHRTWEVDITHLVGSEEFEVEVAFASPMQAVRRLQRRRPLPGWFDMMCIEGGSWLRKELSNFGWDWGPALVTAGIWRPVEIVAFDVARLGGVHVRQQHTGDSVTLTAAVELERPDTRPLNVTVRASLDDVVVAETTSVSTDPTAEIPLVIDQPQRWWPNGLGEQPLYTVMVELRDGEMVLDQWVRRIGLRTLRLVRDPDEAGERFAFECNGVRFFAKGANWIPADAVLGRSTPDDIRRLIDDAADVHMNMLRVWGGGVYEDDSLYDACDERGISVWQDFMFACATYPTFDPEFFDNVRAEATDNVRRLRHHACLALWCGNNELEQGLVADEWTATTMSWDDYLPLFDVALADVVTRLDPDTSYWPGSPHTPGKSRADANHAEAGDAHLWDVWHGGLPFDWYRTCTHPFVSEFGFQSLPEPRTIEAFTEVGDRNIASPVLDFHQRSSVSGMGGTGNLMRYLLEWFRAPTNFDNAVWQTQILQAIAVGIGVEHWRTRSARTMGALYWQLNDSWPGWSWSSIDFDGRWKALHYAARRFFAPLLVTAVADLGTATVEAHVSNDTLQWVTGEIRTEVTRADGTPVLSQTRPVRIGPQQSQRAGVFRLGKQVLLLGEEDLLAWIDLIVGGEVRSSALATFCPPKRLLLVEPRMSLTVRETHPGVEVLIDVEHPALWTWVTLDGTVAGCSDAFLHVRPGQPVCITLDPDPALSAAEVHPRLVASSLVDTWLEHPDGSTAAPRETRRC